MTKLTDSAARKATPIYSGLLKYFPDACAAVARLSFKANEKHNPGEPMHWSRGKSNDHGDCIVRHQMEPEAIDEETGETHACAVAWRALAQLQLIEEARLKPKSIEAAMRAEFGPPDGWAEWVGGPKPSNAGEYEWRCSCGYPFFVTRDAGPEYWSAEGYEGHRLTGFRKRT